MSEEGKKRRRWPLIAALLVGLPVLYVASFGPACWLLGKGWIGPNLVVGVYEPIRYGAELSQSFGNLMDQYMAIGLPAGTTMTISDGRLRISIER